MLCAEQSSRESILTHKYRLEFCYCPARANAFYRMTSPTAISQLNDSGILSYPGLQRRSALRDRRPLALRRHTTRVATRFAVLLTGDIVAILIAQVLAIWLNAETLIGAQSFGSGQIFGGSSPL